jgi:2-polyprenyl-6-methoxyphenol hydroxylase-like FAD-dependent oxidoreductase
VSGRVLLDPDGHTRTRLDMPQVLTSWSRLYELLRRAFPAERYHQGVAVSGVQQHDGGVTLQAQADGDTRTFSADLLVASDGIRSGVRQQLLPAVQPGYAGYVAWRGVCDEMLLSQHTMQTLFPYFGFCVPDGEQIIGYPVAGSDNHTALGQRAYNFVWYRPTPSGDALRALMTDADGQHHPLGIAPHKVSWRHLARMRADALQLLAPQWAEVVHKAAQPFLQPIYDLACDTLAHGRVALLGDAAFVARPHIGMGVTKAAQDAQALCAALKAHGATPAALRAYEAEALPRGHGAVARARWLGAALEGLVRPGAVDRPQQAIAETAIDLGRYAHQSAFPAAATAPITDPYAA